MRAVWNATFDAFGDCEQVATNNFGASAAGGWPTASRSAGSTSDLTEGCTLTQRRFIPRGADTPYAMLIYEKSLRGCGFWQIFFAYF